MEPMHLHAMHYVKMEVVVRDDCWLKRFHGYRMQCLLLQTTIPVDNPHPPIKGKWLFTSGMLGVLSQCAVLGMDYLSVLHVSLSIKWTLLCKWSGCVCTYPSWFYDGAVSLTTILQ